MRVTFVFLLIITYASPITVFANQIANEKSDTAIAFSAKSAEHIWKLLKTTALEFDAFHTQGLVKIGNTFYVSAVEIIEPTKTLKQINVQQDNKFDRTAGKGRGWLFKFNINGELLDKVELGQGDMYHPGGIDFDGKHIWVPVGEYRPNSASLIYRVDPETMLETLIGHVEDHIGNILYNPDTNTLHGSSWGSRRLYRWALTETTDVKLKLENEHWYENPVYYIDYQDCHYQRLNLMLCSGVKKYQTPVGEASLGGIDLIDISDVKPVLITSIPITEYWNNGMVISNNPMWAEMENNRLIIYFLPDQDGKIELLKYELQTP